MLIMRSQLEQEGFRNRKTEEAMDMMRLAKIPMTHSKPKKRRPSIGIKKKGSKG